MDQFLTAKRTIKFRAVLLMAALASLTVAPSIFSASGNGDRRGLEVGLFRQKVAFAYSYPGPVKALAECEGVVYAGGSFGIMSLDGDDVTQAPIGEKLEVKDLACGQGKLAVAARQGLFILSPDGSIEQAASGEIDAVAAYGQGFLAVSGSRLLLVGEGGSEELGPLPGPGLAVAAADGRAAVVMDEGVAVYDGSDLISYPSSFPGLAGMRNPRDIDADGEGNIYIAARNGLFKLADGKWSRLPTAPVMSMTSVSADGGVVWTGTDAGASRFDGVEWQYLQGREYISDDKVNGVLAKSDGGAFIATEAGVARVDYAPMTLEEKAAHMEQATRERHLRHYLVSDSVIEIPGDLSSNRVMTSDNDGLWTAMYIAAECYRYGATGDPEAKKFARQSLEALMFLETVTEIPGFVARSYATLDEPHCSGEWDHVTSDGKWRWKGDTSSDEIVGHYYAYSIYYDICAEPDEKEEIREKVRLMTDYMLDHDLFLLDTDGEPTTWGRWNFKGLRRFRYWERGLNSLEILSHLKAAHHITGDEKYQREYLELANKYGYAKFTVNQKITIPNSVNHSDDELAFLSYYPLMKYETDPALLRYYHASMEKSWQIERPEKCPLWNFIYAAVMPSAAEFDLEESVWTLQRISMNLVRFDHVNSRRDDIEIKLLRGRFDELESKEPLPPDERCVMKWNGNPYRLDGGKGGREEEAGTFWLLPYWMGRYYGYIKAD